MKLSQLPLVLAAGMMLSGTMAFADAQDEYTFTGTVDHVDMASGILYFQDKAEFALGDKAMGATLNAGDEVRVHWMPRNGVLTIDEITMMDDY